MKRVFGVSGKRGKHEGGSMNARILGIFSILFVCSGTWALAQPAQVVCQEPVFAGEPTLQNGIFTATLTSDCTLSALSSRGLNDLEIQQLKEIQESGKVNAGPWSENFAGLPSTFLDVTVPMGDSGTIRSDVHVATDGKSRFVLLSVSKEVKLSGMAGALKKVENQVEVRPGRAGSDGTPSRLFSLQLINTIHLQKPALAPGPIFVSIAKKNAKSEYLKSREKLAQSVGSVFGTL